MGKVGDLHHPEDHGETDRNQAVNTSNDQSVKNLLQKEGFHTQVPRSQNTEVRGQKSEFRIEEIEPRKENIEKNRCDRSSSYNLKPCLLSDF